MPSALVPGTWYAKGRYFGLSKPSPFDRLIYPVPVPGGLGTHCTLDMAGRCKFGPDVEWITEEEYSVEVCTGCCAARLDSGMHCQGGRCPPKGPSLWPSRYLPDRKCQLQPAATAPNCFDAPLQPPAQPLLKPPLGTLPFYFIPVWSVGGRCKGMTGLGQQG